MDEKPQFYTAAFLFSGQPDPEFVCVARSGLEPAVVGCCVVSMGMVSAKNGTDSARCGTGFLVKKQPG